MTGDSEEMGRDGIFREELVVKGQALRDELGFEIGHVEACRGSDGEDSDLVKARLEELSKRPVIEVGFPSRSLVAGVVDDQRDEPLPREDSARFVEEEGRHVRASAVSAEGDHDVCRACGEGQVVPVIEEMRLRE